MRGERMTNRDSESKKSSEKENSCRLVVKNKVEMGLGDL